MRPTMRNQVPSTFNNSGSEKGFAIPLALGMGLVMLLLGMTAIVRSQGDQRVAVDKKFSAQARTAAEIGVGRIQDMLNRNRPAAKAQACSGGNWPASGYGACNDTGTTVSWDMPGNITNLCPSSNTEVSTAANNDWISLGSTVGDYRLENYDYTSASTGVMTVEGRVNGGDTSEARSRLQVTIPVTNPTNLQTASLWVTDSITGTGTINPQINSDVVSPCAGVNVTFPSSTTNTFVNIKTPQTMPTAPTKPTTSPIPYTLANISSIPGKELPRTTTTGYTANDAADTDGVYKYVVTSFDSSFKVTPGKKVWLWVNGDINLSNNTIVNQCGATSGSPATLVNPSCGPFDVRIYPATSSTQTLTLNKGTAVCDVFFHLPNYNVVFDGSTGTTSAQDCGVSYKTATYGVSENTGIYWVKSWAGAVSGLTLLDPPRATWGSNTATTSASTATGLVTPPLAPQIGPASNWVVQSN
jgi:hypothetical protein